MEAAKAAYQQVQSGRLPTVQGQASYKRLSDNIPEVDITIPGSDVSYTFLPVELDQFHTQVSVQQLLFAGGRLNNKLEAASNRTDATKLINQQKKAKIAFEIRRAYWQLYQAKASLDVVKSVLAQITEHVEVVRARVEEGTALKTNLLSAKARRADILLNRVKSRNSVQVAQLRLNKLLGFSDNTKIDLTKPGTKAELALGLNQIKMKALNQRPALRSLHKQTSARKANIDALQGNWFPNLYLFGKYIYSRPNQYFFTQRNEFHGVGMVGLRLQWDIFSGGKRTARISEAKAKLRSVQANLAYQKQQVTLKISQQFLQLQEAEKAVEVSTKSVKAAKEALKTARIQFNEGVVLSEQVLDTVQAYRKARAQHVKAVVNYNIAYASVLRILGKIWGLK